MRATVWLAAVVVAGATLSGCTPKTSPSAGGSAAPSASPSSSPSPAASASPSALPSRSPESAPAKPKITKKALNYFFKIAMGSEYGDAGDNVVAKWGKPIVTVRTDGTLTSADKSCLAKVISDFNALTKTTDLQLTTSSSADSVIHFAQVSRFKSLNPDYVSGNDGFFTVRWFDHEISTANILIRTSGIGQTDRCHLIREELTQSMGLMRDSNDYSDSMFYGRYSTPTRYSTLDKQLITLLYSGALHPGDSRAKVTSEVQVVP